MSKVPYHKHVTLDESIFHLYQDIADLARYLDISLFNAKLQKLDEALAVFHEQDKLDPEHHLQKGEEL